REEYQKIAKIEEFDVENVISSPARTRLNSGGVIIDNMDDCLVKFSRCCNPLPGDHIIGFITRGYGVSIHKTDCTNVPRDMAASAEPERWVPAHWAETAKNSYKTTLVVHAFDRIGLLADVTTQLAAMHVMIFAINTRDTNSDQVEITMTVEVNDLQHLQSVCQRLKKIYGVERVERG
ncbi:MAG: (p)ppGpp synthetase, partial [Oscillospiraceae bacterium]|nr:(p)ppGpp synthetase [Oscillospiraceae bacterium]